MSRRGRGRNDWPTIDDISGQRISGRDARVQWNGLLRPSRKIEYRHPQDFVQGGTDPTPVPHPRTREVPRYCPNPFRLVPGRPIGEWRVGTNAINYARFNIYDSLLKAQQPGVGVMEIGCTFYVYPNAQPIGVEAAAEIAEFGLLTEAGDLLATEDGLVLELDRAPVTDAQITTESGDVLVTESDDELVGD